MVNFNDPIVDIQAGGYHTSFITKDWQLFSCGDGSKGQLGLGECDAIFNPVKVRDNVVKVACGDTHSMILTSEGQLLVTGSNDKYQLGITNITS